MLSGKYQALADQLKSFIPAERIIHDDLRLLAFGTDAGFYRLLPKLVVKVHNEQEIVQIIKTCGRFNIPLTIRAAGTSLSGQAVTDSVLVLLVTSFWKRLHISDDGGKITVQPGLEGGKINGLLRQFHRKLGPDPASINHASIGGIVANNAAGMASGVKWNSYNTVKGMRLVFHDGTLLDTQNADSRKAFLDDKNELVDELLKLAAGVRRKRNISKRIKQKFEIKNTCGYSINALLDYKDPVEMIMHLMVGSEGTLGFISEITMDTVDDPPEKAAGLLFFPNIATACDAIALLKECPVATAELMDRAALRSVENKKEMPDHLKSLDDEVTALLVETRAHSVKGLEKNISQIRKKLGKSKLSLPLSFSRDAKEIDGMWSVRKGLFPSVAAAREKGTTVIIEDIAVPYEHLSVALTELQGLFKKYEYSDAIIWGHALDGNVHFIITQNFADAGDTKRYKAFIDELVLMIVDKYEGSLKAEHGTGRNMAPFVEREWGKDIYEIMCKIKQLFDPDGILNPGVVINSDENLHLKNLKPLPITNDLIDACIECGFCENSCVSRELTLSPRQRIVAYREISVLQKSGQEPHRLAQLRKDYDYYGDQTCATDGLCAVTCPVEINTGELIKELRQQTIGPKAERLASWIAENMDRITAAMRFGLGLANLAQTMFSDKVLFKTFSALRALSGDRLPLWTPAMPGSGKAIEQVRINRSNPQKVVYFTTCINRAMGLPKDDPETVLLSDKIQKLLSKAGFEVIIPENVNDLCCGMAFSSKGYTEVAHQKSDELQEALLKASENGKYPVLADMSPCLYHMKETLDKKLKLFEPIEFTLKHLKDKLVFNTINEPIVIFPVCSAKKMELQDSFLELARMCSSNVTVNQSNCCGFAGDRGFTYPELNAEGLKELKGQIPEGVTQGYSTSRTCEIGLSYHSGINYKSILYLVDKVTTPKA